MIAAILLTGLAAMAAVTSTFLLAGAPRRLPLEARVVRKIALVGYLSAVWSLTGAALLAYMEVAS